MIKKLLVLVFLLGTSAVAYAQADSLGIEKKGEQVLVIHKVKSGQTLFALARRYGASVQEIQAANPSLQQGLKVGQTIKIPYNKALPIPAAEPARAGKTHTVAAGETLYAISRKYNITVDEIKKLNGLSSNALSRGQQLVVEAATAAPVQAAVETAEETREEVSQAADSVVNAVATGVTEATDQIGEVADTVTNARPMLAPDTLTAVQKDPEPVKYNGTTFKEIQEEGVAELIEEEEPTKKFLALHKTAKVGTVIKIRNLKNDLAVYVRVVGNIPDTADNSNILVKINKRAHDQLKAIDSRLRVELSYFQ